MSDSVSVNAFFPEDPLSLDAYWTNDNRDNPDVYVLADPDGEWGAAALADGEVTIWNYYDCFEANGEPDTCVQELLIANFPAFFYRLIALYQRCEGYFDNDVWQQ